MPLLIPLVAGAAGWVGGMWTSDGFNWLFWLGLLALATFVLIKFFG